MKQLRLPQGSTMICLCLVAGLLAIAAACGSNDNSAPPATGGSASGGKNAGGTYGLGGGQGGAAGAGGGGLAGSGGSSGGTAGSPRAGGRTATGGQAPGGSAPGGTTGAAGAAGSSAGSNANGGMPSTGGRGLGGNTGGATNSGGTGAGSGGQAGAGASGAGGVALGGASGSGGSTSAYHPCPTDGSDCKIMPFGDSITDGFNPDTPGGYRVELFRRAHADGKKITFVGSGSNGPATVDGVAFPPKHEGHSGWTIDPEGSRSGISSLLKNDGGAQSVMTRFTPQIVLLMIGTNDAIDNYAMSSATTRLGTLIDTIYSQLPDVLIIVAQPIPSRGDGSKGDDTALSDRLKTYGEAIPAVVKARADKGKHILSVDMFTPFALNKSKLLEDQWHPNKDGYVIIGDQWYSVLQSLL